MRVSWLKIILSLCLLESVAGWADYVIPYTLVEMKGNPAKVTRKITVLVLLPDHFAANFGPQDDLHKLMARNYYTHGAPWIRSAFAPAYDWYHSTLMDLPISDDEVRSKVRNQEMIDGRSAIVAFFELRDLSHPLSLIRSAAAGPNGRLVIENDYAISVRRERLRADSYQEACFRSMDEHSGIFDLYYSLELRHKTGMIGETIEIKNFGPTQNIRAFLPAEFQIAQAHRIFNRGISARPDRVVLSGMPEHEEFFHELIGVTTFGMHKFKSGKRILFMDGTLETATRKLNERFKRWADTSNTRYRLQYDERLSLEFHKRNDLSCRNEVVSEGSHR